MPNSELSAGRISATDVNALHVVRRRLVAPELDIAMASSTAPTDHHPRVSIFFIATLPYNAKVTQFFFYRYSRFSSVKPTIYTAA